MKTIRRRLLWGALAAGLLAVGIAGFLYYRTHSTATASTGGGAPAGAGQRPARAQPVLAALAEVRPMPAQLIAIGTVLAINSVAVRTRLDSQITEVYAHDGQWVKPGDPLFALDRLALEAQRRQAEANLARDQAQLAFNERQLRRKSPQMDSESAIDQARTAVDTFQASVLADRAILQTLEVQLGYTHIDAPIAGKLGTIGYKLGSTVKVNDPTPLVTINQIKPIYVAFSLPQAQLPAMQQALRSGPVTVLARAPDSSEAPRVGKVAYLENTVDPSTSTFSVKAQFANEDESLWPGAYVNVTVTVRTDPAALVIPAQALQQGQEGTFVFVITPDNAVEPRSVAVDRNVGENAVIAAGLQPGERVVVQGQLRLVSGTRVEVKDPAEKAGEGKAARTAAVGAPGSGGSGGHGAAADAPAGKAAPAGTAAPAPGGARGAGSQAKGADGKPAAGGERRS